MPETAYHLQKAAHNIATSEHLRASGQTYVDWAVTTRFYAALHFVDALLDQMALPKDEKHPRKHNAAQNAANGGRGRNQLVAATMRPIVVEYRSLEDASRRSRYDLQMMSEKAFDQLCDQFDTIQQYVRMQLIAYGYVGS